MAEGRRDAAFDVGIKRLLCDDNEDDESFWAYFSEFVDAEPPPLMLPYVYVHSMWISHVMNTTDTDFACDKHD